ncbi:MAG: glutamate--tRNA ligase, partial [Candidatus Sungbacteria bacterium]|nr:glutamate--tRNA ligase [Candidatus Sungbacteria bacterium]
VDDYEMKISHVIRGEDHLANTPKHILLMEALGFPVPQFAHLPLLLGPDRSKLSKRHGATSIAEYRSQGYLPEAMVNFLALLGWNPGGEREILSKEELIGLFSLEKVQKSGGVFDVQKLDWMNGEYIRKKSPEELTKLITPFIETLAVNAHEDISVRDIVTLEQPRLKRLSEIGERAGFFFKAPEYDKELLRWKKMSDAQGALLWPLRAALSGKKASPGPFEIMKILGTDESIRRIQYAKEKLA